MNPIEPAPSERLRPVTWPVWLAWVLVSALIPVFSTISATAIGKQISSSFERPSLLINGLLALVVFATMAPPIMQGLVLKRITPKLSMTFWLCCILLSAVAWFTLTQMRSGHGLLLIQAGFRAESQFQTVAWPLRLAGTLNAAQIVNLPWAPLLLWTISTTALTSLLPAWALGTAAGRQRATLLFVGASIVGACVSVFVEQLYNLLVVPRTFNDWALNGLSWTHRFQALGIRSGIGAVWGATTALVVVLLTRRLGEAKVPGAGIFALHRIGGFALVLIAPLLIAVLAPFAGYLAGPRGVVAGVPELRNALSFAPSQDQSTGETILSYSHNVALPLSRFPAGTIAPDGQTAIVRTADHTLMQVDIATGRAARQLAGALAPSERHAIAWSPDGRYLALRSDNAEVPIPKTHYTRHQSRVRLYALPDLTLAEEFANYEGICSDVYAREPMLFSGDSKSLWLVCGQHYAVPKPDDPMAIRFEVATMQMRDVRRYGEVTDGGQTGGLERIGDSVWAWQFPFSGKSFRILDLTNGRVIVTVPMPMDLIGKLTAQPGMSQVDEKAIQLTFCGVPPEAPADADIKSSSICRTLTFDTRTGKLTGQDDDGDIRFPSPRIPLPKAKLSGHGLRIEAFWREDSKTGELVVRDGATGRERQRIVSVAQRPLQLSDDGRWLMTVGIYESSLRLYRVHP